MLASIISILSIGAITTLLVNSMKFIALPHYRLEINRKKHTEDAKTLIEYYEDVYKMEKNNPEKRSKFELQKLTNAAFGMKNFNYELIFLLFDRDIRDVELIAKTIQNRWILLKVDYESNKIKSYFSQKKLNNLFRLSLLSYFILVCLIIIISSGHLLNFFKNEYQSIALIICFIIVFINAYVLYILATIKGLYKIIDWDIE